MANDDVHSVQVDVNVSVSGIDFSTTFVEVKRSFGSAGHAKIKGVAQNPEDLQENFDVEITVTSQGSSGTMFYGQTKRATIDRKGIITIEAYDLYTELYNKVVQLNTDRPQYATEVARDLIQEGTNLYLADEDANPNELPPFYAYVAPGSEFPGGDTPGHHTYGSAKQGKPLYFALQDLADKLGGIMWVDRNNVLRIEPYPKHHDYKVPFITDLNAGSDTVNKKRVIVKGGTPVGELGQAAYSMYLRSSPTATAKYGEEPKPATKTIEDQNVITKRGTEKLAFGEQFLQGMQQQSGSIKIVGNPKVDLFDTLEIPELEKEIPSSVESGTFARFIHEHEYSVGSVTHTVDASNGYVTKIGLQPDPSSVVEKIGGSGVFEELANELTDKIKQNKQDKVTLGFVP